MRFLDLFEVVTAAPHYSEKPEKAIEHLFWLASYYGPKHSVHPKELLRVIDKPQSEGGIYWGLSGAELRRRLIAVLTDPNVPDEITADQLLAQIL